MLSKTIITFAFSVTLVLAWPMMSKRDECGGGSGENTTTPITTTGSFYPKATYNYDVGTGAIECSPSTNRVTKSTSNYDHDTTTLLTFEYPAASAGQLCQFGFRLEVTDILTGDHGGLLDLFSSLAPAPGYTSGWGPGNQRNVYIRGREWVPVGNPRKPTRFYK